MNICMTSKMLSAVMAHHSQSVISELFLLNGSEQWHVEKCATFLESRCINKSGYSFFLIVKATTLKQQISKFHLQIRNTEGSTTSITVNGLSNVKAFTTRRNCSYFCLYTVYKK